MSDQAFFSQWFFLVCIGSIFVTAFLCGIGAWIGRKAAGLRDRLH